MPISSVILPAQRLIGLKVLADFDYCLCLLQVPYNLIDAVRHRHCIIPFNQFNVLLVVEETELLG